MNLTVLGNFLEIAQGSILHEQVTASWSILNLPPFRHFPISMFFIKLIYFFNWRIIALQNFLVFCQISTWISHRYISCYHSTLFGAVSYSCNCHFPHLPLTSAPYPILTIISVSPAKVSRDFRVAKSNRRCSSFLTGAFHRGECFSTAAGTPASGCPSHVTGHCVHLLGKLSLLHFSF